MPLTLAELLADKDEATLYQQILTRITNRGIRTRDWSPDAPTRVELEHGHSPLLASVWKAVGNVARSGFLSLARALAEQDLARWEADGPNTWLGLLAKDRWEIVPMPPVFTEGLERFVNTSTVAYSLTDRTVVATPTGLKYRVVTAAPVPLAGNGGTATVTIRAEQTGAEYNVQAGAINQLITSLPGVTVSNVVVAPATSWITIYGAGREPPRSVEARCRYQWARVTVLQTAPADAYRSAALDPALTGTASIRKVAVWGSYSAITNAAAPNAVTLYLAGETGPVTPQQAQTVEDNLRPYIGIHDQLYARPCGSQVYAPAAQIFTTKVALLPTVQRAVEAELVKLKADLDIGQKILAFELRRRIAKVADVKNLVETFADFTPAKNALVDLQPANFTYGVQ